jgi:hypothetical protein
LFERCSGLSCTPPCFHEQDIGDFLRGESGNAPVALFVQRENGGSKRTREEHSVIVNPSRNLRKLMLECFMEAGEEIDAAATLLVTRIGGDRKSQDAMAHFLDGPLGERIGAFFGLLGERLPHGLTLRQAFGEEDLQAIAEDVGLSPVDQVLMQIVARFRVREEGDRKRRESADDDFLTIADRNYLDESVLQASEEAGGDAERTLEILRLRAEKNQKLARLFVQSAAHIAPKPETEDAQ